MDFNVKKEYDELYNVSFVSDDGTEYAIDMALQTISFSLDEKGGRVKSEAATDMKTTSIGDRDFRYFYVNDDFTFSGVKSTYVGLIASCASCAPCFVLKYLFS